MKKETTVYIAPTKEQFRTVTYYYCDICTESLGTTLYKKNVCDICRRHCHNNWKCGHDHPEDSGDYPRTLCRICLDLYNELMLPLLKQHERAEEETYEIIKQKSLIS
jgi:hypothetical protein